MGGHRRPSETSRDPVKQRKQSMELKMKLRRWFDEWAGIKHPARLMEPKRILWTALICGAAIGAQAQTTNTQPVSAASTNATGTNSLYTNAPVSNGQSRTRLTKVFSLTDAMQIAL